MRFGVLLIYILNDMLTVTLTMTASIAALCFLAIATMNMYEVKYLKLHGSLECNS